jgi:exodeoxyribonuclease VII large subunit
MSFVPHVPQEETWSVSELTQYIRELFEIDFRLQDVLVDGEISNFTRARSGHLYFTLKDSGAQLKCVMWRSAATRLQFEPRDGDAVQARCRVSVYEASGVYQLYVESLRAAGIGDLAEAFALLKQRLEDEGLFAAEHKQPIPAAPRKLGIVTSPDAAALRDILNVLQRRYPLVSVLIAPTLVQGAEAPAQIVRALQWLDGRADVDTILVARGGGSIEDLWAFNDEAVARAIFSARHPVICGVGHETDFTIADFVADLRAPTPSAAAELAVPDQGEIRQIVTDMRLALRASALDRLEAAGWQLAGLARSLKLLSPRGRLDAGRQRLDTLVGRLDRGMSGRFSEWRAELRLRQSRLESVSPLATLRRGYAIVRGADGSLVRSVAHVETGQQISVELADGRLKANVTEKE